MPVGCVRSGIIRPTVLTTTLVVLLNIVPGLCKLGVVSSLSWMCVHVTFLLAEFLFCFQTRSQLAIIIYYITVGIGIMTSITMSLIIEVLNSVAQSLHKLNMKVRRTVTRFSFRENHEN